MGKLVTVIGLFFVLLIVLFCSVSSVVVNPGQEVVLVDRPYFFGHEGVRAEPLKSGRTYVFSSTKTYPVSVVPVSFPIAFNDFTSKDNILLDFESTVQYKVNNSPQLIENFGPDWFNNNIKPQYTAMVRNIVKTYSMSDMMSDPDVANKIDEYLTNAIEKLVKDKKIPIEILSISLGRAKPNDEVLHQMNLTAAQQQRSKTLIAAQAAEVNRKAEETAKAEADNAYRNSMGMTPEQYIELQKTIAYSDACSKAKVCIVTSNQSQSLTLPSTTTK